MCVSFLTLLFLFCVCACDTRRTCYILLLLLFLRTNIATVWNNLPKMISHEGLFPLFKHTSGVAEVV